MHLIDSLERRPYRELRVIAGAHRLPFNNRRPKPVTVARLHDQLAACLRGAVKRLSTPERGALRALQAAGGTLPTRHFEQVYGAVTRWRPWRTGVTRHPWRRPPNAAQALWNQGLIHVEPWGAVTLLREVDNALGPLPRPTPVAWPGPTGGRTGTTTAVAAFLGTLLAEDLSPWRGHWLSPAALKAINRRLPTPDPTVKTARSERRTGRVRFLHYLCVASGLVTLVDGYLRPTPAAWRWLALDPASAWDALWAAVDSDLSGGGSLWAAFDFDPLPSTDWRGLRRGLAALSPGTALPHTALVDHLRPYLPATDPVDLLVVVAEPLAWLGLWRRRGETVALCEAVGAAVDVADLYPRTDGLWLQLPFHPQRRALVDVLTFARPVDGGLCLDAAAIRRACERGLSLAEVERALTALCGRLPRTVRHQIANGFAAAERVRLRHLTVLEADPETLAAVRADWRLRPLLGDTLSPRHYAVDPANLPELARRLARRGLPTTDTATRPRPPHDPAPALDPALAGYLWLAVRTYQRIAAVAAAETRIPAAVTDWLAAQLPPAERDALNDNARTVVRHLSAAPAPKPSIPPVSDIPTPDLALRRADLENAARSGTTLSITYTSPEYGTSHREIAPVLLYDDGDFTYVDAWCHRDRVTRTFRLDRFVSVTEANSVS